MIYFTKISSADGRGAEEVVFQFYPRELPETIPFGFKTKVNHIEYPGGFVTNQIIGIYQDSIEWEGTFFGTYKDENGGNISAKERAFKIKELMGMPIRCVFAVPTNDAKSIPGYSDKTNVGKKDSGSDSAGIKNGVSYVYIIEEYEVKVSNYTDVDYRIKLTPHQRQEKIKPKEITVTAIKIDMVNAENAGNRIAKKGIPGAKGSSTLTKAAKAGSASASVAEKAKQSAVKSFRERTAQSDRANISASKPGSNAPSTSSKGNKPLNPNQTPKPATINGGPLSGSI